METQRKQVEADLSADLVKHLQAQGMTLRQIADTMGLSESFISRVAHKKRSLTIEHLLRLQEAIHKPLPSLLMEILPENSRPEPFAPLCEEVHEVLTAGMELAHSIRKSPTGIGCQDGLEKAVAVPNATRSVFVIMPFSSTASCTAAEWTEIYENVFRPAVERCGYSCRRANPKTGSLIAGIIEQIRTADIVLADVTDHNPNVFYELGVRHALNKRTIIVSRNSSDIPFDLRGYLILLYGVNPTQVAEFARDIELVIRMVEEEPGRNDSPVSDYLEREDFSTVRYTRKEKSFPGSARKLRTKD